MLANWFPKSFLHHFIHYTFLTYIHSFQLLSIKLIYFHFFQTQTFNNYKPTNSDIYSFIKCSQHHLSFFQIILNPCIINTETINFQNIWISYHTPLVCTVILNTYHNKTATNQFWTTFQLLYSPHKSRPILHSSDNISSQSFRQIQYNTTKPET